MLPLVQQNFIINLNSHMLSMGWNCLLPHLHDNRLRVNTFKQQQPV